MQPPLIMYLYIVRAAEFRCRRKILQVSAAVNPSNNVCPSECLDKSNIVLELRITICRLLTNCVEIIALSLNILHHTLGGRQCYYKEYAYLY